MTGRGEYSMRVVTRMTGLSADTIRAWERRYGAVVPARTDGNTRRYSASDVRRLGLLKEATDRGHRIGDIAKLSEGELAEIAGSADLLEGARAVWHSGMRLLAVTQGAHGAVMFTRDECVAVPGFSVDPVDTVGCGDAFLAALLCGVLADGTASRNGLERIGLRACAAGALAATKAGGMASLPTAAEVDRFLASRG